MDEFAGEFASGSRSDYYLLREETHTGHPEHDDHTQRRDTHSSSSST